MAWWEERLRLLRLTTIRDRFPFVPVQDWQSVDTDKAVYPWGGSFNVQVVQLYNRAALVHTVPICSKAEIDFLARAMRHHAQHTSVPTDAIVICVYADAADIDLASSFGIEKQPALSNSAGKDGFSLAKISSGDVASLSRKETTTSLPTFAQTDDGEYISIGNVQIVSSASGSAPPQHISPLRRPTNATFSVVNVAANEADWRRFLISAGFEEPIAAQIAPVWSRVPCPTDKRAIPFDRLKEIEGTRMGHIHKLMKWAGS